MAKKKDFDRSALKERIDLLLSGFDRGIYSYSDLYVFLRDLYDEL